MRLGGTIHTSIPYSAALARARPGAGRVRASPQSVGQIRLSLSEVSCGRGTVSLRVSIAIRLWSRLERAGDPRHRPLPVRPTGHHRGRCTSPRARARPGLTAVAPGSRRTLSRPPAVTHTACTGTPRPHSALTLAPTQSPGSGPAAASSSLQQSRPPRDTKPALRRRLGPPQHRRSDSPQRTVSRAPYHAGSASAHGAAKYYPLHSVYSTPHVSLPRIDTTSGCFRHLSM